MLRDYELKSSCVIIKKTWNKIKRWSFVYNLEHISLTNGFHICVMGLSLLKLHSGREVTGGQCHPVSPSTFGASVT